MPELNEEAQVRLALELEKGVTELMITLLRVTKKLLEDDYKRMRGLLREARDLLDEAEEWQPDTTAARFTGLVERIDDELAKE